MPSALTFYDAASGATERPSLRVGRFTYRGRVLSFAEWAPWYDRARLLEMEGQKTPKDDGPAQMAHVAKRLALAADYLRCVFVRPWYRRYQPEPIARLERMAPRVLSEAFARFFVHQLWAMGMIPPSAASQSVTDGPNSPPSTVKAPSDDAPSSGSA